MIRKLVTAGAGAALLLSSAVPAFAWGGWSNDEAFLKIKNWAYVNNDVTTKADSGDNSIHGKFVKGGSIITGNAGASSGVSNDVNTNIADLCGCFGDFDDVTVKVKNSAVVKNDVYTKADTGDNSVGGKYVFGGVIDTGDAGAEGVIVNTVNTNVLGDVE